MLFFFKQKTAYELRISDWSSDVCSSDLLTPRSAATGHVRHRLYRTPRHRGGGAARPRPGAAAEGGALRRAVGAARAGAMGVGAQRTEYGRAACGERGCQYA